jgi:hypothetical protein
MAVLLPRAGMAVLLGGGLFPISAAEVGTAEDLAAVIALHGKPCGKVVDYQKHSETDFIARCATGDVYRVSVDERGRVRVDPQT